MEIVWSVNALENFLRVVDFLFEKWTLTEVNAFELIVDNLLEKIAIHNDLCPKSNLYGYRKCIIDNQNSLIYTIVNNKIFLISFIDNRSQVMY